MGYLRLELKKELKLAAKVLVLELFAYIYICIMYTSFTIFRADTRSGLVYLHQLLYSMPIQEVGCYIYICPCQYKNWSGIFTSVTLFHADTRSGLLYLHLSVPVQEVDWNIYIFTSYTIFRAGTRSGLEYLHIYI